MDKIINKEVLYYYFLLLLLKTVESARLGDAE